MLVVVNATPTVHYGYRIGVPARRASGTSSSTPTPSSYGGSGIGNLGLVDDRGPAVARLPAVGALTLPPLAVVLLESA